MGQFVHMLMFLNLFSSSRQLCFMSCFNSLIWIVKLCLVSLGQGAVGLQSGRGRGPVRLDWARRV